MVQSTRKSSWILVDEPEVMSHSRVKSEDESAVGRNNNNNNFMQNQRLPPSQASYLSREMIPIKTDIYSKT